MAAPPPVSAPPPIPGPAIDAFWRTLIAGGPPPGYAPFPQERDALAVLAHRLAGRISPGLADLLLAPLAPLIGRPLIDSSAARNSRLLARLPHAAQSRALQRMIRAGLRPVAIKGYANAHLLYDPPEARIVGDIDVMVRRADVRRLIELFRDDGFRFAPFTGRRWGFVSNASYAPFHSPDAQTNIDIHVAPDSWPLPDGLPADIVFARARSVASKEGAFMAPSDEHTFLIAVSNIAKDRFGPPTLTKVVDAARLLVARDGVLDWDEISRRARAARLERALGVTLRLMFALGLPPRMAPRELVRPLPPASDAVFQSVHREWRGAFETDPSAMELMRREARLATTRLSLVVLNLRRLRGLLLPRDGVPDEGRDLAGAPAR